MLEKLREIICEFVQLDPQSITEQTNIRTDLGLNSLELVNLAVAIEDAFDLEIPDRAVVGIETVADVIALLEEYSED
ncbi:MAG: acyl carrier protein [Clostridia bacterium]|nr:acyl carrier protein [Clostridia bacterium]MBR2414835.1 acyl carrier protein [Clostridia bacterium]MBR3956026.1 acyl carrier protein [Clostridia bacterium]